MIPGVSRALVALVGCKDFLELKQIAECLLIETPEMATSRGADFFLVSSGQKEFELVPRSSKIKDWRNGRKCVKRRLCTF